jgi:Bacterial Ig domain
MLSFFASARDGTQGSCGTCNCHTAAMRPGETNLWLIDYSKWLSPIMGRGLVSMPSYQFERINHAIVGMASNQPPTNTNYAVSTFAGTPVTASVATNAIDPEAGTLIYAFLPLYGPRRGLLTMTTAGAYTYTPIANFSGYDEFWFTTSDGINRPVVNRVAITVNNPLPAPALPAPPSKPTLWIDPQKVSVTSPQVHFPVTVSPAAMPGDIWRLTLAQQASDCRTNVYVHEICFDIKIEDALGASLPRSTADENFILWNGVQW